MKALTYQGPGQKVWGDVPDPGLKDPTDAVVRVDTTTICGTDLHILKGDVPAVTPGRVLGHEAVGTVVDVGAGVGSIRTGDRVLVPAITSCGTCAYCRVGQPSHCESVGGIGWIFGHLIDGTQAELVRVPYADTSLHKVPEGLADEQVIFLADIFPTGYEMGVRYGQVSPGDNVVCLGAGPVGLAAMLTSHLHGAKRVVAVDLDPYRREQATAHFGATHAVDPADPDWLAAVRDLCDGRGAEVVMEAVGIPATLESAFELVRPGGHIANIGVHGKPVTLPIDRLWIQNITMTMGLVDGVTAPMLMELIAQGILDVSAMGTHTFTLDQMLDAYDVFGNAAASSALKVVIRR